MPRSVAQDGLLHGSRGDGFLLRLGRFCFHRVTGYRAASN
jgi:hypothetical protein